MTPSIRIRSLNEVEVRGKGSFVLYWMTAFRRLRYNFALQRAVEWSQSLRLPLVILESIRLNYRWSCDRFHQFMIDGMREHAQQTCSSATYCAYVEPELGHSRGLMETMAKHAALIVTDDFPCFFHPTLYDRVAKHWPCAIELVDSNTIVPMRQADRTFTVAHSYRRAMQKVFYQAVPEFPLENPLSCLDVPRLSQLPSSLRAKWGVVSNQECLPMLSRLSLSQLDIDHTIPPTAKGGETRARELLSRFVESRLIQYSEDRNKPELVGSSGLSPYLHFGHISPQEVFLAISNATKWTPAQLSRPNGKMDGFWNMGTNAEAFLDQLLTWREIGFNQCWRDSSYDQYESLPDWARQTLEEHADDERPSVYTFEEFEKARTHDPLWNAAQRQLVREGVIHNYLRMLWGKKILHWSRSPQEALKFMIKLNNKYALDGRDPNSYSGIFWVLGRYDRAWGPERPIFGKIRYMTSESTQSKYSVKKYIERFSEPLDK